MLRFEIQVIDRIIGRAKHAVQALCVKAQTVERLGAIALQIGFNERALDGRGESLKAALQDIVGGATLQAFYRLFLSDCPGEQNNRDAWSEPSNMVQRGEIIETRYFEVAKNKIELGCSKGLFQVSGSFSQMDLRVEARFLQCVAHQLGVRRVVLQMQDPKI